jgi:regulator of protease activity HflC (stomatin/prohibitin superfamily)
MDNELTPERLAELQRVCDDGVRAGSTWVAVGRATVNALLRAAEERDALREKLAEAEAEVERLTGVIGALEADEAECVVRDVLGAMLSSGFHRCDDKMFLRMLGDRGYCVAIRAAKGEQ